MRIATKAIHYSVRRRGIFRKGSLAILDQALISGSNFAIGILLARWLPAAKYGMYALTFSIFLLLSQIQQALLLEPQSVLGPADFAESLSEYLGALVRFSLVSVFAIALALGMCGEFVYLSGHNSALAMSIAGIGIAGPAILMFWLVRGACYVRLASSLALRGSALYCLSLVFLFILAHRYGVISPFSAYAVMGAAAAFATGYLLIKLRPKLLRGDRVLQHRVLREHWNYGKWALAAGIVTWIPWNLYYGVLARFWSMSVSGEYRAMMNLLLPLGQTLTALSLLAHPTAARKLLTQGSLGVLKQSSELVGLYALLCAAYWAVLLLARGPVIRALYGGHYAESAILLPWFACASILWFSGFAPPITLRAIQSPVSVFMLYGFAAIVTLAFGLPLAIHFGIRGAILGASLSSAVALATGLSLISLNKTKLRLQSAES